MFLEGIDKKINLFIHKKNAWQNNLDCRKKGCWKIWGIFGCFWMLSCHYRIIVFLGVESLSQNGFKF